MKKSFVLLSVALSFNAFADIDYSRCTSGAGIFGLNIDNDGKLELLHGQEIKSISTEDGVEKYVISSNPSVYGFNSAPYENTLTIVKDKQGRITKLVTGEDKPSKKEIENYKKTILDYQVGNAILNSGSGTRAFEPTYYASGSYKKLSELNKEERESVGLSEDVYKEMKSKWRKDKKTVAKIKKGLQELSKKSHPVIHLGVESEVEIKDGVCSPVSIKNRYFHTQDDSNHSHEIFSKEACIEVEKLFEKHKNAIASCESSTNKIYSDLMEKSTELAPLNAVGAMGPGLGMSPMSSSGGMIMAGGIGHSMSPLQAYKNQCDMWLGKMVTFGSSQSKQPGTSAFGF